MFNRNEEQQQLALSERNIVALQERVSALRERIDQMVRNGQDTRAQEELLCTMLDVLESIQFVRLQLAERLRSGDHRS